MKLKSLSILLFLTFLQLGCKKDTETNALKFISISGVKSGTTGVVSFIWTDSQNSNWNIVVRNQDGTIRNNFTSSATDFSVASLDLDSTFTFGVTGNGKPSQNGSFDARIGGTGDVLITNIKP